MNNIFNTNTQNQNGIKQTRSFHCDNCGCSGHDYRACTQPITSWGIILVRMFNNDFKSDCKNPTDIKKFDGSDGIKLRSLQDAKYVAENMESIKFLLVSRKHSLGYTEFIRGNYKRDNIDGIIYLFRQMMPEEIKNMATKNFDELWDEFWGNDLRKKAYNKKQYFDSKENFDSLKNKVGVDLSLDFYIKNVKPLYDIAEYGLPKGRKQRGESDIECAIREFCEETGYAQQDIKIINNVKPIIENMTGTNGISYRFVYYLAEDISENIPKICEKNSNEIGNIGFYSYNECLQLLREYHDEKRNIIKNVFMFYLENLIKKQDNKNSDLSSELNVELNSTDALDQQTNNNAFFSTDFDEF